MPSDAPSPDALDIAMDELGLAEIEGTRASEGPDSDAAWRVRYDAARAAVRRLAEQGEVYEVRNTKWGSEVLVLYREGGMSNIATKDKVRVTRIEEAP